MLSYKMDFSSCDIMPGFGKSSHIYIMFGRGISYTPLFIPHSHIWYPCTYVYNDLLPSKRDLASESSRLHNVSSTSMKCWD